MSGSALPLVMPKLQDEALERLKYTNLLKALRNRRQRSVELDNTPLDVTIDLCTACHLRCPYCATGSGVLDRRAQTLSVDEHQRILGFCGENIFTAWYFSNGEPLLNKRLPEIIADAQRHGIFTVISTSLSVPLSDARLDALLLSGLNILSCSIDGCTAEVYNQYRIGGDFALVMRNLERLIARKAELGLEYPLIEWRFLAFRHNQHQQAEVARIALDKGVDMLEFFPGSAPAELAPGAVARMTEPLASPALLGPAIAAGLKRRDTPLRQHSLDQFVSLAEPPRQHLNQKCDWLYFGGMYYPDGSVGPCCLLGNRDTDFGRRGDAVNYQDIWNNAQYRDARSCFNQPLAQESRSVCAKCPGPEVQDRFFRQSLRAYLLNAPEWFLKTAYENGDQLFYPVDLYLMPDEFVALGNYGRAMAAQGKGQAV